MADRTVSTVTRTVTISDLTPAEMASIFAEWYGEDQAEFFNALAVETGAWPALGWQTQADGICRHLDERGQKLVAGLADSYIASIAP